MNCPPCLSCSLLAGSVGMTVFLGGCTHHHALVADSDLLQPSPANTAMSAPIFMPETNTIPALMMLNELGIGSAGPESALAPSTSYKLPELVAGDWLAWQCALVGGYWDMHSKQAPAFAEAFESDQLD